MSVAPHVQLLDELEAPSLREFLGPVLAGGTAADFAVTRVRLAAVDLEPADIAGLTRCRLLLGRVDAQTLTDARRDPAAGAAYARRLDGLRELLRAGVIQVHAAGTDAWSPDFSVIYQGVASAPEPALGLVGAHYFARPFPVGGPALTCVVRDGPTATALARRFEELWRRGYDIGEVIDDALTRMLATVADPGGSVRSAGGGSTSGDGAVREPAAAYAASRAERLDRRGASEVPEGPVSAPRRKPSSRPDRPDPGDGGAGPLATAVLRRMLVARFGPPPGAGDAGSKPLFDLAAFQREAVERAAAALAAWRGVVIADAVGLGKTYVALGLLERAVRAGRSAAVIGPAALRKEWVGPLRRLRSACGCASVGVGGEEPEGAPGAGGGFVAWLTHTRLSRGTHEAERLPPLDLVVVDEAHAFRSPRTRRHRALAELCRGARVVLLTATPVNNSPEDLRSLLRLFAADGAFREIGVPSLADAFAEGASPTGIARVLERVMIRRTRPFVRERHGGVRLPDGRRLAFPRRAAPVPVRYTLDDALPGFAAEATARIAALSLAPLRLGEYGGGGGGGAGAVDLLRIHLLKRLESGTAAFEATLRHQVRFLEAFLDALHRGRLLAPREHTALHAGDRDAIQLSLDAIVLGRLPSRLDREALEGDVGADLHALRSLARALAAAPPGADPKLAALRALLDGPLAGEKVLIFTEFRDTARHIWRVLADRGHAALIDGGGAFLGRSPAGRREVIERFAPRSNGRPQPPPRERVDLLIATDVLAEGLNLQDARRVVSYDLPWNPVRLIQRIGRIDRLGSAHETVFTYHFLPEHGLEEALRLLDRLRAKIAAIGRTVGGEDSPLTGRRGPGPGGSLLDRLAAGDAAVLDEIERAAAAPFEAEERIRAAWRSLDAGCEADCAVRADRGGPDAFPAASIELEGRHRVLLAVEAGSEQRWLVYDVADARIDADPRAADVLAAAALERAPSAAPDDRLMAGDGRAAEDPPGAGAVGAGGQGPVPRLVRAAAAAAFRVLRAEKRARQAAAGSPRSPAGLAGRRALQLLGAIPGGPEAALCARGDAVLERLRLVRDPAVERRITRLLEQPADGPPEAAARGFLGEVEEALAEVWDAAAGGRKEEREARIVAVLEVRPAQADTGTPETPSADPEGAARSAAERRAAR